MLKNDSRQTHRWTCVHCRPSHPECADHKTVEEGMVHWWRHHCHPACWVWCDKATALGVTAVHLKVLSTKAEGSMLMPSTQIEGSRKYLTTYEAGVPDEAQTALNKVQLGGRDKENVSAVKTYALSAHKLLTPVNIWVIPYPSGHAAVFASPNKLSLVSSDSGK